MQLLRAKRIVFQPKLNFSFHIESSEFGKEFSSFFFVSFLGSSGNCWATELFHKWKHKTNWSYPGWKSFWMENHSGNFSSCNESRIICNDGKKFKYLKLVVVPPWQLRLSKHLKKKPIIYVLTSLNHNFTNWNIFQIPIFVLFWGLNFVVKFFINPIRVRVVNFHIQIFLVFIECPIFSWILMQSTNTRKFWEILVNFQFRFPFDINFDWQLILFWFHSLTCIFRKFL